MSQATYNSKPPTAHTALNITKRCNQRCVFCFEGDRKGWEEPSLEQVKERLRRLAEREKSVIFMGAEALLRPDILEVIRFARSLGLGVAAFTNGQVFARADFPEALTEAGLTDVQLSAHYADVESFARGTLTPPRFFERYCRGLENVAAHNRRHPDRRLKISAKTVLFRYNLGRLPEIQSLLRRLLGDAMISYMISSVHHSETRTDDDLLEPVAARREELLAFMARWEHDREFCFSMVPLCLIPGWEHYSYDVKIIANAVRIFSNFRDKSRIGDMHDYLGVYRQNAYRWLCRECNLLALCPAFRTSWNHPGYLPAPDQRFTPVRDRTAEDVLGRLLPLGELPDPGRAREYVRIHGERIRAWPVPEHGLYQALKGLRGDGVSVTDVACDREPIFHVTLSVGGAPLTLHLSHPRPGAALGYLVQYLRAQPVGAVPPGALEAALRALASLRLPELSAWEGYPRFDPAAARSAMRLWKIFGESLWPRPDRLARLRRRGMKPRGAALALADMRRFFGRDAAVKEGTWKGS